MKFFSVILFCVFGFVSTYQTYRSKIPNGHSVPNPCGDPTVWSAVGHYNPTSHTFYKNPFARDFKAALTVWTPELCLLDSDQDGATNGEELGDPTCVWSEGGQGPTRNASGHPGICEPIGSSRCAYQNFACDCLQNCPGLDNSLP